MAEFNKEVEELKKEFVMRNAKRKKGILELFRDVTKILIEINNFIKFKILEKNLTQSIDLLMK